MRMTLLMSRLNSKLRGYYNYYGVRGNYDSLKSFYEQAIKNAIQMVKIDAAREKSYTWTRFFELLKTL
jgi:hypothetical protein